MSAGLAVVNLSAKDPFAADLEEDFDDTEQANFAASKKEGGNLCHIRIQQRNGRKTLTTIQGLPSEFDPKKVLKAAKKQFHCNGSIVEDENYGQVIQLQGDQRAKIAELLMAEGIGAAKERPAA